MTPIIIDSSALVALMYPDDADHPKAVAISAALRTQDRAVLVPLEVVAETLNILGKKYTHTLAVEVGERLLQGDGLLIFQPSEAPIRQALAKWRREPGSVSFTDCMVMAYADQFEATEIFGFDAVFMKDGYCLPEAAEEGREAA